MLFKCLLFTILYLDIIPNKLYHNMLILRIKYYLCYHKRRINAHAAVSIRRPLVGLFLI